MAVEWSTANCLHTQPGVIPINLGKDPKALASQKYHEYHKLHGEPGSQEALQDLVRAIYLPRDDSGSEDENEYHNEQLYRKTSPKQEDEEAWSVLEPN